MLDEEITAVYPENHTKPLNTLRRQNAELHMLKEAVLLFHCSKSSAFNKFRLCLVHCPHPKQPWSAILIVWQTTPRLQNYRVREVERQNSFAWQCTSAVQVMKSFG
jgi:hypothetical protein